MAQRTLQAEGYSGLHYADISEALGITRAAVHYHFPNKLDLARRVMADYREQLVERLEEIDRERGTVAGKMGAYIDIYRQVLADDEDLICPGGMLAAEVMSLPPELNDEVQRFFDANVSWVAKILATGDDEEIGGHSFDRDALGVVAALQGALLVARLYRRSGTFDVIAARLLREHLVA
ncbi:MAG: TetR/AcrR family transcriptional regulator [Solirubrobacterales bacterium]